MPLSIIISFYKASVSHTINPLAIADISPNSLAVHHNLLWLNLETEAVHRMIAMEIIPHNIMDFIESDTVYVSRDYGILYKLENEEKVIVKRIEEKYNLLVYHAIDSISYGDRMLTLFFVPADTEDWGKDRIQLMLGRQYCYVFNFENNKFSEFGSAGFSSENGGLVRTW